MSKPLSRGRSLVLLPQPRPCLATLRVTWSSTLFTTNPKSFMDRMRSMGIVVDSHAEFMYPWFFDETIDKIPTMCHRTFCAVEVMEGMIYASAYSIARSTLKKFPGVSSQTVSMRVAVELLVQFATALPRRLSCERGTIVLMHSATPRHDRELSQLALTSTAKNTWRLTAISLKDQIPSNPTNFIFGLAHGSPIPIPSRLI